jgi:hypothetical protein
MTEELRYLFIERLGIMCNGKEPTEKQIDEATKSVHATTGGDINAIRTVVVSWKQNIQKAKGSRASWEGVHPF